MYINIRPKGLLSYFVFQTHSPRQLYIIMMKCAMSTDDGLQGPVPPQGRGLRLYAADTPEGPGRGRGGGARSGLTERRGERMGSSIDSRLWH